MLSLTRTRTVPDMYDKALDIRALDIRALDAYHPHDVVAAWGVCSSRMRKRLPHSRRCESWLVLVLVLVLVLAAVFW